MPLPRGDEKHPLLELMSISPIELGHCLIQWTNSSSVVSQPRQSFQPFSLRSFRSPTPINSFQSWMNFIGVSDGYRYLLTIAMNAFNHQTKDEPVKQSWSMKGSLVTCRCRRCQSIIPELEGPNDVIIRVRAPQSVRKHVEIELLKAFQESDFTFEAIPEKTPHTLKITKQQYLLILPFSPSF
jgi:hypothetical protein